MTIFKNMTKINQEFKKALCNISKDFIDADDDFIIGYSYSDESVKKDMRTINIITNADVKNKYIYSYLPEIVLYKVHLNDIYCYDEKLTRLHLVNTPSSKTIKISYNLSTYAYDTNKDGTLYDGDGLGRTSIEDIIYCIKLYMLYNYDNYIEE